MQEELRGDTVKVTVSQQINFQSSGINKFCLNATNEINTIWIKIKTKLTKHNLRSKTTKAKKDCMTKKN